MAKEYTDLCAFKRFLKSHKIFNEYKKELRKQHPHGYWSKEISAQSKKHPTGLYDIINYSLSWVSVSEFEDPPKIHRAWNNYWLDHCSIRYWKKFSNKFPDYMIRELHNRGKIR